MIGSYFVNGRGGNALGEDFVCLFTLGGTAALKGMTLGRGQGILLGASRWEEEVRLPREGVRLDFSERELLRAFGERGIRPDGEVFSFETDGDFERVVRFFFERGGEIASSERALAMTSLLLSYTERVVEKTAPPAAEGYVRYAEDYIREHLSESIQVDTIAEELGISRGYLRNVFFSVHGMSPREYLTDARLRRAEDLLAHGGQTVTEVAAAVGYEDVLQFSRIFKKHTGSSPSGYREAKGGAAVRRVAESAPKPNVLTPQIKEPEPQPKDEAPRQKRKDPVWLF